MSEIDRLRGERQAMEQSVVFLRAQLTAWKTQESQGTTLRAKATAALFWAVTSRWTLRIEGLVTAFEAEAAKLRSKEAQLESTSWPKRLFR